MSSGVRPLRNGYLFPGKDSHWKFFLQVSYLEESGAVPRSDNSHSICESTDMGVESVNDECIVFAGQFNTFKHKGKRLNLKNHTHGIGFGLFCSNKCEVLFDKLFFISDFTQAELSTLLTEGLNDGDTELVVLGATAALPIFKELKLVLGVTVVKHGLYATGAKLAVPIPVWTEWKEWCKTY